MPDMREIRHFIWDFDGTLFDTYPNTIRCVQQALADFGHTADAVEMMALMLETIPFALHHYADTCGIAYDALQARYAEHRKPILAALSDPPLPGVERVLQKIADTDRSSYVFTHRQPEETRSYLRHWQLERYFCDMVAPGTEGFAAKPAPDAVYHLIKKYGIRQGEAVMIGDREIDLGSGRNGGIFTAHIVCPTVPQTLSCDWRFTDFEQMLTLL